MSKEKLALIERIKKIDKDRLILYLAIGIFVSLFVNFIFTGWIFHILTAQYPGTRSQFNYKQHAALRLLDHNRIIAEDLGVQDRSSVKEALADFSYDIETASNRDDLRDVILEHPPQVEEIIHEQWQEDFKEEVIEVVNRNEGLDELNEFSQATVKISSNGIEVEPIDFLSTSTTAQIEDMYASGEFIGEQIIEMEISDGKAQVMAKESEEDYVEILSDEVDSLRESLRELRTEAGYSEKGGSGLVVKIYDDADATTDQSIVHDTDIRDVVNELYASGAEGVAVGGQRLTTTSSVRCTGPLIKVDDNLIPVNPVKIEAVGDPELLRSGVSIIRNTLEGERELYFEIETSDSLTLPAYTES